MELYNNPSLEENDCYKYAAIRNILYNKGKCTEVMVSYEPCYAMMNEWWKQLFGESEGKDNKGCSPPLSSSPRICTLWASISRMAAALCLRRWCSSTSPSTRLL